MEYEVRRVPPSGFTAEELEQLLNVMGEEGWRLHSVVLNFLVFERPLP